MSYLKKIAILWMVLCMTMLSVNIKEPVQAAELKGSTRAEQLFNFFYDKGYSAQAAAAIVGTVMWETCGGYNENFPLHITQKGTYEGIGICQWSYGRKTNFIAYCKSQNVEWTKSTLKHQAEFLEKELKSGRYWMYPSHVYSSAVSHYKMSYSQFKTQTDVTKAVGGILFNFLRPSEYYAHTANRVTFAKKILSKYEKVLYAPTDYKSVVSGNDVQLNWSTKFPATKSRVQVYDVNCKLVKTHTTKNNHYKVKDLKNGVYFIRVGAVSKRNEVKYSTYRIAVIGKSDQRQNVMATNVTVEAIDFDSLQVKWTAAKRADHYVVYRSVDGDKHVAYKTLKTNSFVMDGAQTGLRYSFKIKTYSKIDGTVQETPATTSVRGKTKLNDSINLEITRVDKTRFKLNWNAVAGAHKYEVYMKSSEGSYTKVKTLDSSICEYATNVLLPDTYSFKVRASRYDGDDKVYSSYSNVVKRKSVFTKPTLEIEKTSDTSLELNWEKSAGVPYYSVYQKIDRDGTYKKIKSGTFTTYSANDLKPNQTYYYKVKGYRIVDEVKYYTPLSNQVEYSL